jgi:hypothetical protein
MKLQSFEAQANRTLDMQDQLRIITCIILCYY